MIEPRCVPRSLLRWSTGLALLLVTLAAASATAETIHLIPDERASWRVSNLFAWIRPNHNFGERFLQVETTPPDATLDLFYVRSNFQKRYEQTQAPARVILPRRVEAGPRDAVTIRAFREGYRQREVSIRVSSAREQIQIDLDPLPNSLVATAHTYFGGRGSLAFLTTEPLTVRMQDVDDGFHVILAETAGGTNLEGALTGIGSPLIASIDALQLGEDLLVRVRAPGKGGGLELRARQSHDELRDLHRYTIDMIPGDGGVEIVRKARAALAQIRSTDISGCARFFDSVLRDELDPAALARALAPRGSFTDPYLRAAMKRLGQISPGKRIRLIGGARFDSSSAIELEAALSQAAEAEGFLALLRSFVAQLEPEDHADATLRGLVAPETEPDRFRAALAKARAAEARCR